MEESTQTQTKCGLGTLSRLPLEVRRQIWKEFRYGLPPLEPSPIFGPVSKLHLSYLLTSRQIYLEAIDELYGGLTFTMWWTDCGGPTMMVRSDIGRVWFGFGIKKLRDTGFATFPFRRVSKVILKFIVDQPLISTYHAREACSDVVAFFRDAIATKLSNLDILLVAPSEDAVNRRLTAYPFSVLRFDLEAWKQQVLGGLAELYVEPNTAIKHIVLPHKAGAAEVLWHLTT